MLHKIDKNLQTIISTVRWVRIVLDRAHLSSILGIRDERNKVTIDFNRKTIQENLDWSSELTSNHFQICPHPGDRRAIHHGDDVPDLSILLLQHFSAEGVGIMMLGLFIFT